MQPTKLLEEGDIIEITTAHTVYADVPERLVYSNRRESNDIAHHRINVKKCPQLAGRYVVYKTYYGGGGTGMGPHDVFPDGYHVSCVKMSDDNVRIDFYQTGSFTAMIENIKPIGRARLRWEQVEG